MYGERKIKIGQCFNLDSHYYMQRKDDVLHVSLHYTDTLINSLHVGCLNNSSNANILPITHKQFDNKVKESIYLLDIGKYKNERLTIL